MTTKLMISLLTCCGRGERWHVLFLALLVLLVFLAVIVVAVVVVVVVVVVCAAFDKLALPLPPHPLHLVRVRQCNVLLRFKIDSSQTILLSIHSTWNRLLIFNQVSFLGRPITTSILLQYYLDAVSLLLTNH